MPTPLQQRLAHSGGNFLWTLGLAAVLFSGQRHALGDEPESVVDVDLFVSEELLKAATAALAQPERPNNRFNNLSDILLKVEDFPEERLAQSGAAEKLLTAAGVEDVAEDELVGIVVDAQGRPVPGAKVHAWSWVPGHETKSDERGLFRLKDLDHRTGTQVVVTKEGYGPRMYLKRRTGRKDWIVILRDKTFVKGTVLGADGQPVAGATIRAACGPFNMDGGVMTEYTTEATSGEDGSFLLFVMPNLYDIQASAPKRGVMRRTNLPIAPNQSVEFDIPLEPGVRFEARVLDSRTKQPVGGFRLFKWRPPRISGRSDEKGVIVFEDLIPGEIDVQCGGGERMRRFDFDVFQHGPFGRWWSPEAIHEHERFHVEENNWQRNFDGLTFNLTVGMPRVTILVEQGVAVSGRVTDPNGQPVEGATVAPARTGTGNSLTGDTRYSVETDKEGRYHVVLPASNEAEYNLVVHDGKYSEWRRWANGVSEVMQTTPGQVIENLDLQLTVPAVIRGRVTRNGKPVADREVRAHDFHQRENRYYDPTVRTQADGTFELKFVRPGKHYVQAHPFWLNAAEAPEGTKTIEVKAGDVLEDIELQVSQ